MRGGGLSAETLKEEGNDIGNIHHVYSGVVRHAHLFAA